jgi:hypothetical protein
VERTISKVVLSPESPGRRSFDPHKSRLKRYSQSSVKGQSTVARSGLASLNKKKRKGFKRARPPENPVKKYKNISSQWIGVTNGIALRLQY